MPEGVPGRSDSTRTHVPIIQSAMAFLLSSAMDEDLTTAFLLQPQTIAITAASKTEINCFFI
jgi:hypothetical protein